MAGRFSAMKDARFFVLHQNFISGSPLLHLDVVG